MYHCLYNIRLLVAQVRAQQLGLHSHGRSKRQLDLTSPTLLARDLLQNPLVRSQGQSLDFPPTFLPSIALDPCPKVSLVVGLVYYTTVPCWVLLDLVAEQVIIPLPGLPA